MKPPFSDSETVVQRQLDAYNAHDVETMAATYAEDAQQFEHPSTLLASGLTHLRERWTARFQDPLLHAELLKRTVMGRTVIDHESVRSSFRDGPGKTELIAIYEVRDGRIAKAWFIIGAKTLDQKP
jgi:hypothetical protein